MLLPAIHSDVGLRGPVSLPAACRLAGRLTCANQCGHVVGCQTTLNDLCRFGLPNGVAHPGLMTRPKRGAKYLGTWHACLPEGFRRKVDGFESRPGGARHLLRKSWRNQSGIPKDCIRNGLSRPLAENGSPFGIINGRLASNMGGIEKTFANPSPIKAWRLKNGMEQLHQDLKAMHEKIQSMVERPLTLPVRKTAIARMELEVARPGFWDDSRQAQREMRPIGPPQGYCIPLAGTTVASSISL